MDSNVQVSDKSLFDKPTPDRLSEFLPWACQERQVTEKIQIKNVTIAEYTRTTGGKNPPTKDKANQVSSRKLSGSLQKTQEINSQKEVADTNVLHITAIYDAHGNLVHLKFDKKATIKRMLFKIILLMMKYHAHLNSITLKSGVDYGIIHELNHLLVHNITDLCLDDTNVPGGYYEILLENQSQLKNISLARCNINDHAVKRIAAKLYHALPASKTLTTLNLATNKITDEGARDIAKALRSNRCLVYLNLSDNRIMDDGCVAILDSLEEFVLTDNEILETRYNYLSSLKEKLPTDQVSLEEEKKLPSRKKTPKIQSSVSGKKSKLENQVVIKDDYSFIHPFSRKNTRNVDTDLYCYGNNQLEYLNVAYNNLTLFSLQKMLHVVKYQKSTDRKPRGLINVVIEGNFIPKKCSAIDEINSILTETVEECSKALKTKKKPRSNSN